MQYLQILSIVVKMYSSNIINHFIHNNNPLHVALVMYTRDGALFPLQKTHTQDDKKKSKRR